MDDFTITRQKFPNFRVACQRRTTEGDQCDWAATIAGLEAATKVAGHHINQVHK